MTTTTRRRSTRPCDIGARARACPREMGPAEDRPLGWSRPRRARGCRRNRRSQKACKGARWIGSRPMSVQLVNSLYKLADASMVKDLSRGERHLLHVMCDRARDDGQLPFAISYATFGRWMSCTRKTAIANMAALITKGYVQITFSGHRIANSWQVVLPIASPSSVPRTGPPVTNWDQASPGITPAQSRNYTTDHLQLDTKLHTKPSNVSTTFSNVDGRRDDETDSNALGGQAPLKASPPLWPRRSPLVDGDRDQDGPFMVWRGGGLVRSQ